MKKIEITDGEDLKVGEMETTWKVQKSITEQIIQEIKDNKTTEIVISVSLGSMIMDHPGYSPMEEFDTLQYVGDEPKPYQIGYIAGADVVVDPNMTYNDTRVLANEFEATLAINPMFLI